MNEHVPETQRAQLKVSVTEFGQNILMGNADVLTSEGQVLFTAGGLGGNTEMRLLLEPEQSLELGKALVAAGREGRRRKRGNGMKP